MRMLFNSTTLPNQSLGQKVFKEPTLFYSVLLVNLVLVFSVKYFPSMDGPAHLYNSNVLRDLLKGPNSLLGNYYDISSIIIPNWLSHFMLTFFKLWLPAWLSEKAFLALYIFSLAFSFRLLIKQLSPQNISLSVLIFPFIYTHLFCIGFYNYSFSFVFLFLALYYYLKTEGGRSLRQYFLLFLLITFTYYSGILAYGFLGLTLGLCILAKWINIYLKYKRFKPSIAGASKELLILLAISLPTLVMLYLFYHSSHFPPPGDSIKFKELLNWLNDGRAIIAYAFPSEALYTRQFVHIILIIISFDLYQRYLSYKSGETGSFWRSSDLMLFPVLLSLVLFFAVPDDSGARMMSLRYAVLFFLLLIVWIASSVIPKQVSRILVVAIIYLHFGLLFHHYAVIRKGLVPHAEAIHEAGNLIKPGSVVLPVNLSDNWLELHFSNYLGVDNPMVILENYEANVGWFPVIWDKDSLPDIQLGNRSSVNEFFWMRNERSTKKKPIDYVFIYGNFTSFDDKKWDDFRKILMQDYHLVKVSDQNYYMIFGCN